MDEVCGVWTGFLRPGLCCGGCQYFEIGQLSQMEAFKKAFIKKITFPLRHRAVFCILPVALVRGAHTRGATAQQTTAAVGRRGGVAGRGGRERSC